MSKNIGNDSTYRRSSDLGHADRESIDERTLAALENIKLTYHRRAPITFPSQRRILWDRTPIAMMPIFVKPQVIIPAAILSRQVLRTLDVAKERVVLKGVASRNSSGKLIINLTTDMEVYMEAPDFEMSMPITITDDDIFDATSTKLVSHLYHHYSHQFIS